MATHSDRPANSEPEEFDSASDSTSDPAKFELEELDLESSGAEALDFNQLHDLGNQAIAQGLIIGHGYHQGKYELLHRGEALLLSPPEALSYLRSLLPSTEQADG